MKKRVLCFMLLIFLFGLLLACMSPLEETDGETIITDVFEADTSLITPNDEEILPTPPSNAPKKEYSTLLKTLSNTLNIRALASTSSEIIGQAEKGDLLPYEGESDYWYETFYAGKTAFVSKRYTEMIKLEKSSSEYIENNIWAAQRLLGYPYIFGAARYLFSNGNLNRNFEMGRFDCSSFTQYSFYKGSGIVLGMTTRDQVLQGTEVSSFSELQRGDLMFFTNSSRKYNTGIERIGHVAIFLGDNYILHTSSDYAVIEPLSEARLQNYITARRMSP